MKNFLLALLFLALTACSTASFRSPAGTERNAALRQILRQSTYENSLVPKGWPETYQYNPVVVSVVSSLYSRLPARQEKDWRTVRLAFPENKNPEERFFSGSLKAHFRKGKRANSPLFVLIPGSYASFKNGSYINQVTHLLDQQFEQPHILAFPGVLTSAFLKGHLDRLPWDVTALGRDLFLRIQAFASQLAPGMPLGAVGFSGGASVVIELLAQSGSAVTGEPRFSLGGMAFSPVLHQRLTFANIDDRVRKAGPNTGGLTTLDPGNAWSMVKNGFQVGWRQVASIGQGEISDFENRFFNEQSIVDLRGTLQAVGLEPDALGAPASYERWYVQHSFKQDMNKIGIRVKDAKTTGELFERRTDVRNSLSKIREPLLLYFSADDPLLSTPYSERPQPEQIVQVIEAAEANPHILVFNPKFGGHVGATTDEIFPQLIRTFFAEEPFSSEY